MCRIKMFERIYTRDARVPLSADDPEMENGWCCVPIPPTADDDWEIFDWWSKDNKTGWQRSVWRRYQS